MWKAAPLIVFEWIQFSVGTHSSSTTKCFYQQQCVFINNNAYEVTSWGVVVHPDCVLVKASTDNRCSDNVFGAYTSLKLFTVVSPKKGPVSNICPPPIIASFPAVLPDKFSNCLCKKLFQVHKMFINLELKQSTTIWYKIWSESESVSEVVAYRISGGENFRQPPDSLTPCLTFNLIPPTKKHSREGLGTFHSCLQPVWNLPESD